MSQEFSKKYKNANLKILFVDDEEKTRKYFAKGLDENFDIFTAENVDEAKKILEQEAQNIAIVITDQRMPGGNGVILLNFLKEKYPQIVRLLTTAHSDLSEAIEAVNNGEIFRYISKPWEFNMLRAELVQAMELFTTRKERDRFLQEKMTVKQTMAKIERLRSLILISRSISNFRFADVATVDFVKNFVLNSAVSNKNLDNIDSYELLSETLFILNIQNILNNKLSGFKSVDFVDNVKEKDIGEICQKIANNLGLKLDVKFMQSDCGLKINKSIFNGAIKELLQQVALFSIGKIELSFELKDKDSILLNFSVGDLQVPESLNILNIPPLKVESNFYLSLLVVAILIGHHAGSIKIKKGNNTELALQMPLNPEAANEALVISDDEIDDLVLSLMLE